MQLALALLSHCATRIRVKFTGSEQERVAINRQVLVAGADIIDLEWGTDASRELLAQKAPMILSNHDFTGMPNSGRCRENADLGK